MRSGRRPLPCRCLPGGRPRAIPLAGECQPRGHAAAHRGCGRRSGRFLDLGSRRWLSGFRILGILTPRHRVVLVDFSRRPCWRRHTPRFADRRIGSLRERRLRARSWTRRACEGGLYDAAVSGLIRSTTSRTLANGQSTARSRVARRRRGSPSTVEHVATERQSGPLRLTTSCLWITFHRRQP